MLTAIKAFLAYFITDKEPIFCTTHIFGISIIYGNTVYISKTDGWRRISDKLHTEDSVVLVYGVQVNNIKTTIASN